MTELITIIAIVFVAMVVAKLAKAVCKTAISATVIGLIIYTLMQNM